MIAIRNLAIITVAAVLAMAGIAAVAAIPFEWVAGCVLIVEIATGATLAGAAILRRERRRRERRRARPGREYGNDPDNRLPAVRVVGELVEDDAQLPARPALPEPRRLALPAPQNTQEVIRW